MLNDFDIDTFIPEDDVICRGYRREAAKVLRDILGKALRHNPAERYQSATDMLDDIARLKKLILPPKFALPTNLTRSPYFVDGSRDDLDGVRPHAD